MDIWESLHWIVRKHKFKTRKSLTKKHQQSSILAVPFKQSKARSNEWPVWASANHLLNINYFLHWYMFVCLSQRCCYVHNVPITEFRCHLVKETKKKTPNTAVCSCLFKHLSLARKRYKILASSELKYWHLIHCILI